MGTNTQQLKVAPGGIVRKVALVLIRDRALVFARSKSQTVLFYNLGGKVEQGESSEEALTRECEEEGDITLVPGTIKHVHTFEGPCHGYVEGTKLLMECYEAEYLGMLEASGEVAEIAWFTTADKQRTTPLGQEMLDWFYEQDRID